MELERKGYKSEANGSYTQLINANKTSISSSDEIIIEQYISGYGVINGAKIYFSPSANIIDSKNSYLLHGIKRLGFKDIDAESKSFWAKAFNVEIEELNDNHFKEKIILGWGGQKFQLPNNSFALSINSGIGKNPTSFFDNDQSIINTMNPIISTERKIEGIPPFKWNIKFEKKIKPGNYKLNFVLTYYNGNEYVNDNKHLNVKVLHWYEKYEKLYKYLALITASLAIISGLLNINDKLNLIYLKKDKVVKKSKTGIVKKIKADTILFEKQIDDLKTDSIIKSN